MDSYFLPVDFGLKFAGHFFNYCLAGNYLLTVKG
jgi:hypothetical protein